MMITLNLEPEQERQLEEIAAARGLSVEGYLRTMVEALVRPKPERKRGLLSATRRWRGRFRGTPEPQAIAEEAIRQIWADLLAYKERAVEAVTRANMLQKTIEQQERQIVEKELQALTAVREGHPAQALRCYQESRIYAENLQHARAEWEQAGQTAGELLAVFKREEARWQERLSPTQTSALETIQSLYRKAHLTQEQMQERIQQAATPEQWHQQFEDWVQERATPESAESRVGPSQ